MIALLDGHGRPFVRGMNGTFGGDLVPQELPLDERTFGLTGFSSPADTPIGSPSAAAPSVVFDLDDFVVFPRAPPDLAPPGPPDFIDLPIGPVVMPLRPSIDAHFSPQPNIYDWWSAHFSDDPDLGPFGVSDFLFALF